MEGRARTIQGQVGFVALNMQVDTQVRLVHRYVGPTSGFLPDLVYNSILGFLRNKEGM